MKKYWKRLFSLLMTLCMMSTVLVPSALAGEVAVSGNGVGISAGSGILEDGNDSAFPQNVIVPNGVRVSVRYIYVYPAYHDKATGSFICNESIVSKVIYQNATQYGGANRLSVAETEKLLADFEAKYGVAANAWQLQQGYTIYLDGKGSYGKYFEVTTNGGTCLEGKTIRYNLSRTQTTFTLTLRFDMPENTSSNYTLGASADLYYYRADNRKTLSTGTSMSALFNWPT